MVILRSLVVDGFIETIANEFAAKFKMQTKGECTKTLGKLVPLNTGGGTVRHSPGRKVECGSFACPERLGKNTGHV
jgi:hypothetical protein